MRIKIGKTERSKWRAVLDIPSASCAGGASQVAGVTVRFALSEPPTFGRFVRETLALDMTIWEARELAARILRVAESAEEMNREHGHAPGAVTP